MNTDNMVLLKWVTLIATVYVLIGGLNWLSVGAFDVDLVRALLGKGILARAVYILVGLSAVYLFVRRDTYLPFLGSTVFPVGALVPRQPQGASQEVTVRTIPNAKVVYWASEPAGGDALGDYKAAYGKYDNAGVTVADAQGDAKLKIRGPPQSYTVPWKGQLGSHIHFRVVKENGWMGRVETYWFKDGSVEPFENSL